MSITRRSSVQVSIGAVRVGGGAPIVVQSMTNTDTADIEGTVRQVQALVRAGSELVRITVNTSEAAAAVAPIRERLERAGVRVPLIGDFHFNGHKLLREHPDCAAALAKYRINPGNVGRGSKRDPQFAEMIEAACRYDKPVRIGVNWGSLDADLLTRLMDENSARPEPLTAQEVTRNAVALSALGSARRAEELSSERSSSQLLQRTLTQRAHRAALLHRRPGRRRRRVRGSCGAASPELEPHPAPSRVRRLRKSPCAYARP